MKYLYAAVLVTISSVTSVAFAKDGEVKAFNCMDKSTFEVDSKCMSQKIESNLVFKTAEKALIADASNASDRVLATVTFNAQDMTIHVLAHKDATIAKVDLKK